MAFSNFLKNKYATGGVVFGTVEYYISRLDGSTTTTQREQVVQRFNSRHSSDFVLLLSSKAGGTGLNLIGASRILLYDMDWNPATDLQVVHNKIKTKTIVLA